MDHPARSQSHNESLSIIDRARIMEETVEPAEMRACTNSDEKCDEADIFL